MVFGQKWTVKLVASAELVNDEGEEDAGSCLPDKKLILINKNQPKEEYLHTFLHECFHALFHRVSINQALSYDLNEVISDCAATWVTETFDIKLKK